MIIISPSKNLNLVNESHKIERSSPIFEPYSKLLISKIKKLEEKDIKSLMNVNDSLAKLNYQRFKEMNNARNVKKSAVFLFSGGTFSGLSIRSMKSSEFLNAQKKLRILSGLYGMLKPFDIIEPYRLEMGTNTVGILGNDLYSFWKKKITTEMNRDIKDTKSKFMYNLASKEYSSVLDFNELECKVINFDFKKKTNNNLKGIGMMIKKLRGSMASYIIRNKIKNIEGLKNFNELGFKFLELDNSNNQLIFVSR